MITRFILGRVIDNVLDKVTNSPNISLQKPDVPAVRDAVTNEVFKEVIAHERHLANQEPWYKSRVLMGSFFVILGSIGSIGVMWFDGVSNSLEDYWFHVAAIGGAAYAIYGRTAAKKPIGE